MKLNSNVDVATTTTTVASSSPPSSASFFSPLSPHPSIVPGSTASEVEVTLDLTMSCKSESECESVESYGRSGHSPQRIYSSDISPYPSYCNKGNTSFSVPSTNTKASKMISCKNSLDVLNEEEPSSYVLYTGGDLSSFSPNRPMFHDRHLPYSVVLNSSYNKLSPMNTSSVPSNHIHTFIHRPMSPCYLSSNSLSSSLSAISSSSVSSSSSSDNDSLDELEHLASKFNLNIASIWSNTSASSTFDSNCNHSQEDKSSLIPSNASCDSSEQQALSQRRQNESQWLKCKQRLPPQSQSQATYDALNSSLFPTINHNCSALGNVQTTDTSIIFPPPPPPPSSLANCSATAAIASMDAHYVTQQKDSKIVSDISPSVVTGLVSIWSFDSADQVNGYRSGNLKSQSTQHNGKSSIETNPKQDVELLPSDIFTSHSHSRQKGKSAACSGQREVEIETIDLTQEEFLATTSSCEGDSVPLLDENVITIDGSESITRLEKAPLPPTSSSKLSCPPCPPRERGEFKLTNGDLLFLTRRPLLLLTECLDIQSLKRSIERKLNDFKSNTVTKCSGDNVTRNETAGESEFITSSSFPRGVQHPPHSPITNCTNIHTGDDSSDLLTQNLSMKGRKSTHTHIKTIKSTQSLVIDSDFDGEPVSLVNHTASSLFKPGSRKSSHSQEEPATELHRPCNLAIEEYSLSLQGKALNHNSQVPPWYLHCLANVMSSDSASALAASVSAGLTYDDIQRLKSLYLEKSEDLYTSPRTHFQPIRQDYYERPCNTVTDSTIVGMVPCSRNCPNHTARAGKGNASKSDGKTAATSIRTRATPAPTDDSGPSASGNEKMVPPPAAASATAVAVRRRTANSSTTNNSNCNSQCVAPVIRDPSPKEPLAALRPMSESLEELASFIGPFSPVNSSSMSDSEEYQDEHCAQPLSRGVIVTSGDSTTPTPSTATSVENNEPAPCDGNAWSSVSFSNQGEISNHQLTTLSVIAAGAHASMTDGNGDIEVPSKCSSSINGKNALTTEGECSITLEVVTPGESGTNSKDNRLLSDKIVPTLPSSSNCESNEMIVDAHTLNKDQDTISVSSRNRFCLLNQAAVTNYKPHYTRKMDHATGKSSKVVIEELESDDEVTSTGAEFAMVTTTATTAESASKVTIEDTTVNRPDSPVDDYATICSIVNDVLKNNQIVIEEGNYEDELKLLPSDLRQRHQQLFTRGRLFTGERDNDNRDAGGVSSSNFAPTSSRANLNWSLDSPNNWSLFSSSRFSSSAASSPSLNESPIRSSNGVSSTTAFHCEASSTSNSSTLDSFEYAVNSGETHCNHQPALARLNNADIAIFTDGSSNSSNSSSSYPSLSHKQQQYSQVSSTVTPSDSVVSSSNHEVLYGTSTRSTCSSSSTNPYYDSKLDLVYNSSAFGHLNDPFVNGYANIHAMTSASTSHQQYSPSPRVASHPANRAVSARKSSSGPGQATGHASRAGKLQLTKNEYPSSLNHPPREKSSSPTVYQIEPRLEKVTAFSSKPCTFFLEGNCRKSDCKYSHDLSTITCKFWKEGFCFKGDLCPFAHDDLNCNSQLDGSLFCVNEMNEEEKNVFTIDSEADFPSLANEKNSKHGSGNLHSSQIPLNHANSKELASKRGTSNKISSTNVFTSVASVLNPAGNSFLSPSQTNSPPNVLFKSQSNVKGKKKKRTTLKAI